MRKIREVLRLSAAGMSGRQIAVTIGSALSTVRTFLPRPEDAGLGWRPEAEALSEAALHERFYRSAAPASTRPVLHRRVRLLELYVRRGDVEPAAL